MPALSAILQEFFTTYMVTQRGMSSATVRTYRDTWKMFLMFLSTRAGQAPHTLQTAHIDAAAVVAFLDYLEHERGNSVSTRNLRLAAIKSVTAFYAIQVPEQIDTIARVQAIPIKKRVKPDVTFLTAEETQALLDAIPTTTWTGRRDKALFALAAQTGLRLSELMSLTTTSVHLSAAPYVACMGKGRKRRSTPLTGHVTALLTPYLTERITRGGDALFPNRYGARLSADAIQQRFALHLHDAAATCPSLVGKQASVHTLRHTAAMRFLDAGIDTAVIALWLGHESIATTGIYLHADMRLKRAALDRTRQPDSEAGDYHPTDSLLDWLENL